MPTRRPIVGSIVQYCPGDLQHDRQAWHAAICTRVRSDGSIDLVVAFSDGSSGVRRSRVARYDGGPDLHAAWRWPEAV